MPDVLLFPGHADTREHLEHELAVTETADIARRIDQVATTEFGLAACFDIRGDLVRLANGGPEHADMAAFALSLARYRTIQRHPSRSTVLLGHSFGHLTALTCAARSASRTQRVCSAIATKPSPRCRRGAPAWRSRPFRRTHQAPARRRRRR